MNLNQISIPLLLLFLFCGCSKKTKTLTHEEKSQIERFVTEMNRSLEEFDYSFVKEAWNHELFRQRVTNLDYTERGVFKEIYRTSLSSKINGVNVNLINLVKHSNGALTYLTTEYFDDYAEVSYMANFDDNFNFRRYRIEMHNNQPWLTDIYFFKEEHWLSQTMKKFIKLSTRHTAMSPDRHAANQSLFDYQSALSDGDTISAFYYLKNIPKSHQLTNDLRISKIKLAASISDSLLLEVLDEEQSKSPNLYINYLTGYYLQDSLTMTIIVEDVARVTGAPPTLLDSLNSKGLVWH
nr:hypothetical protein [Allomuricauda sp.]